MKNRRTRKEQSRDRQQHYGGLAEKEPDGDAAKRFVRKAYSSYGKTGDFKRGVKIGENN